MIGEIAPLTIVYFTSSVQQLLPKFSVYCIKFNLVLLLVCTYMPRCITRVKVCTHTKLG